MVVLSFSLPCLQIPSCLPVMSSPASSLYSHALQSIFQFCRLSDLHSICAVSRGWSAAVLRTPSIMATVPTNRVNRIGAEFALTRLARHVGSLSAPLHDLGLSVSAEECAVLATNMPQLREITLAIEASNPMEDAPQLVFPGGLQRVNITILSSFLLDQQFAIDGLAQLPRLESLSFSSNHFDTQLRFDPLVALSHTLRNLKLSTCGEKLTPLQMQDVRAMPWMESMVLDTFNASGVLLSVLSDAAATSPFQPALQWKRIQSPITALQLDPQLAAALVLLPSVQSLWLRWWSPEVGLDFLAALPHLRELHLAFPTASGSHNGDAVVNHAVASLKGCVHLTSLRLNFALMDPEQLASIVVELPRLQALWLYGMPRINSISFLLQPMLQSNLTELSLVECNNIQLDEGLRCLFELRGLTSLRLDNSFEPRMSASDRLMLRERMPQLKIAKISNHSAE